MRGLSTVVAVALAAVAAVLLVLQVRALADAFARGDGEPEDGQTVAVRVEAVFSEPGQASMVLLAPIEHAMVLPVVVEAAEADRLAALLVHQSAVPPGAEALHATIASLGGQLERVVLEPDAPMQARGRLFLRQGRRMVDLLTPASESIALALADQAPLFVSRRMLLESGMSREQFEALQQHPGGPPDLPAPPGPLADPGHHPDGKVRL